MSTSDYKYELLDEVPELFHCKKCSLVARKATLTTCCTETYCQACIVDLQETHKVCLLCGEEDFNTIKAVKYEKAIEALQVYCSMKERGCGWIGTLGQLDTHLDPDQDNCQYVDTKCPLKCQQVVPKNEVEEHVAQHCSKRPHVCQHCGFKGSYEEVVESHLQECKYVPLQCPNLCGVSCDREDMEDHLKICRLQEVTCKFSGVGCDDLFQRENQDEHAKQSIQQHLSLTASQASMNKQHIQDKFEILEQQYKTILLAFEELQIKEEQAREETKYLKEQLEEQKEKGLKLKQMIGSQENQLQKVQQQLEKTLLQVYQQDVQEKKLEDRLQILEELHTKSKPLLSDLSRRVFLEHKFVVENFSKLKEEDTPGSWKSPPMYSHMGGYKFCIGVDANGRDEGQGNSIYVYACALPGEYDHCLRWPVKWKITVILKNQRGKDHLSYTYTDESRSFFPINSAGELVAVFGNKVITNNESTSFTSFTRSYRQQVRLMLDPNKHFRNFCFVTHSEVASYLNQDRLQFELSVAVNY